MCGNCSSRCSLLGTCSTATTKRVRARPNKPTFAQDHVSAFLDLFVHLVHQWGPAGYVAFTCVYAGLEVLAVPAIPLTMTAGAIFGLIPGTILVSIAANAACTVAFLIARYVARDRVQEYAASHPKFAGACCC